MIRPVKPDDIESLIEIAAGTEMFRPQELDTLRMVLTDYFRECQDMGHKAVMIDDAEGPVGFSYYAPADMTDRTWHLWWIVVRREMQGQGVGKQLLRCTETDIAEHSGRMVFIETGSLPSYEPTRQFYIRNGYHVGAVLQDFYRDGESMVVFVKRLHPS